ncbi:UNVERIFIED_CONTAM: hypothetical protein HDU68_010353 [Siphonaria sp. JEL0065]|nr:hypothetical protein HDU68_010353 [Siphonaria sp. JEL0065]
MDFEAQIQLVRTQVLGGQHIPLSCCTPLLSHSTLSLARANIKRDVEAFLAQPPLGLSNQSQVLQILQKDDDKEEDENDKWIPLFSQSSQLVLLPADPFDDPADASFALAQTPPKRTLNSVFKSPLAKPVRSLSAAIVLDDLSSLSHQADTQQQQQQQLQPSLARQKSDGSHIQKDLVHTGQHYEKIAQFAPIAQPPSITSDKPDKSTDKPSLVMSLKHPLKKLPLAATVQTVADDGSLRKPHSQNLVENQKEGKEIAVEKKMNTKDSKSQHKDSPAVVASAAAPSTVDLAVASVSETRFQRNSQLHLQTRSQTPSQRTSQTPSQRSPQQQSSTASSSKSSSQPRKPTVPLVISNSMDLGINEDGEERDTDVHAATAVKSQKRMSQRNSQTPSQRLTPPAPPPQQSSSTVTSSTFQPKRPIINSNSLDLDVCEDEEEIETEKADAHVAVALDAKKRTFQRNCKQNSQVHSQAPLQQSSSIVISSTSQGKKPSIPLVISNSMEFDNDEDTEDDVMQIKLAERKKLAVVIQDDDGDSTTDDEGGSGSLLSSKSVVLPDSTTKRVTTLAAYNINPVTSAATSPAKSSQQSQQQSQKHQQSQQQKPILLSNEIHAKPPHSSIPLSRSQSNLASQQKQQQQQQQQQQRDTIQSQSSQTEKKRVMVEKEEDNTEMDTGKRSSGSASHRRTTSASRSSQKSQPLSQSTQTHSSQKKQLQEEDAIDMEIGEDGSQISGKERKRSPIRQTVAALRASQKAQPQSQPTQDLEQEEEYAQEGVNADKETLLYNNKGSGLSQKKQEKEKDDEDEEEEDESLFYNTQRSPSRNQKLQKSPSPSPSSRPSPPSSFGQITRIRRRSSAANSSPSPRSTSNSPSVSNGRTIRLQPAVLSTKLGSSSSSSPPAGKRKERDTSEQADLLSSGASRKRKSFRMLYDSMPSDSLFADEDSNTDDEPLEQVDEKDDEREEMELLNNMSLKVGTNVPAIVVPPALVESQQKTPQRISLSKSLTPILSQIARISSQGELGGGNRVLLSRRGSSSLGSSFEEKARMNRNGSDLGDGGGSGSQTQPLTQEHVFSDSDTASSIGDDINAIAAFVEEDVDLFCGVKTS